MRLKLLLFALMLSSGVLYAQDTIRTLIITEARMDRADNSYVEITNVGTTPIQLANFEFGRVGAWTVPYSPGVNEYIMLPERVLQPGESFTIACVLDFTEEQYPLKPDYYNERITKKEMWTLPDLKIHMPEPTGDATDSITPKYQVMETWNGRETWYLEQHLSDIDSVVVDQVGGVFDESDGTNADTGGYDVAGVTQATNRAILMRKFIVKQGNTTFVRGVGNDDSEWIAVPHLVGNWEPNRAVFWTFGNHGDYKLDENTLVSDKADIDFANSTITVAWGVRNQDAFMHAFEQKPGIAWHYDLSTAREDSAYMSAREGDKITLYVIGSQYQTKTFDIKVAPATADANIVVPKFGTAADGYYTDGINSGGPGMFGVTVDAPGMDSITNSLFGIPYATKVDTLFKYLEKAPKASWEIVWVDNTKRADVKNGDILKVTAENGSVKEYFIKVGSYRPNHNADLSSITWPDIPKEYRDLYGWIGDTIPNFASTVYNYKVQVPFDVEGIPALVAKTQELNTTVVVNRASSLSGSKEQKTITFTVTAEDGTTVRTYTVELEKEKNPNDVQPYNAEPFLSELVFRDAWSNGFVEIANPGNQIMDLSNYMFTFVYIDNPADAISSNSAVDQWPGRYQKYIPGYKWVNEATWAVNPGILEQDLNVNPYVYPGDVFVMAEINSTGQSGYPWFASEQSDIIFNEAYNPWGESTNGATAAENWWGANFYIFKILNDSIKAGLKPANDPLDFELIEVFGMGDGSRMVIGGVNMDQTTTYIRKPEFSKGKTLFKESFGTNPDDSEWLIRDRAYWNAQNVWWNRDILYDAIDIGKHFMNDVTAYKSTVSSTMYKVSAGYSMNESIVGVKTGTTVADFMGGLTKADEMQTLTVMRGDAALSLADILLNADQLVVLSADSTNTSKYMLTVNDGLSSNAVLTTTNPNYTITIEQQPKSAGNENAGIGNITGFDYGTALRTIIANITVPPGASMAVINGEGAYVSFQTLNFDTTYVPVTVNDNIYLDVVAENGVTEIVYQLVPASSENDAFVLSDIYNVKQKDVLIEFVPRGTSVSTLLSNIVGSAGATLQVVDKMGHQRMDGSINDDDKVVVTSANGKVSKAYYLSMLAEEFIPVATYHAYILSDNYPIDQVIFKIDQVAGDEGVSSFLTKVNPAAGATAVVVDKDGMVKTTGDIDKDDMVKVTSADGKIMVYYTFGQLVSSRTVNAENIQLYPNPTKGEINVSGVKAGYRIQVYNSVGSAVRDINVQNSIEKISLGNQPAGMYMIVVSDNNKMLGRYKAVKQ